MFILVLIINILIINVIIYIVIPLIIKIFLRKRFLLKLKKDNHIYLTFDDGPNPESTPKILELLKKYKVKATFFVTGINVEKYPDLIEKIIMMGHSVGQHGYNHCHPWKTDPYTFLKDLLKYQKIFNKFFTSSNKVQLYRPPYGKLNILNLIYCFITKKRIIFWNIDPKDYNSTSSYLIAKFVTKQLAPGGVVLLHDGRSNQESSSVDITFNAVELILKTAIEKKLNFRYFL